MVLAGKEGWQLPSLSPVPWTESFRYVGQAPSTLKLPQLRSHHLLVPGWGKDGWPGHLPRQPWVLNFRQSLASQPLAAHPLHGLSAHPTLPRNLHEAPILPTLGPGTTLAPTQGAHFTEKAKPERQDAEMDGFPSLKNLSRTLHPLCPPSVAGVARPKT